MTAQTTSTPNESRLKRRAAGSGIALFISAIILLAVIGFFASHSGIDKKLAEKRLAEWTKTAAEMAAEQGYVLTLTYDSIDIKGSLFSKKAIVNHAVLSVISQAPEEAGSGRTLATDVFTLDPDVLGGGLSAIFTDPLIYTTPKGRMRIVAGEPIEMVVEDYKNESGSGLAYTLLTPPHVSVERLGRQSDAVISTTDFSFGPKSKIYGMIDRARGTYTQEAKLAMVGIKGNDYVAAIGNVDSVVETANQNGSLLSHYQWSLNGITLNGPLEALGAMNAKLDVEFEEPTLVDGEPLNLSLGRDRNITLEKLLIESPHGKLIAKARLRQVYNEIMPFGNATLQIENPVQLLETVGKTNYLKNVSPALVTTMLTRLSPDWKGDNSPITLDLKREPNGPFYVGSLTFEEFTAVLLSQLLHQAAPELPLGLTAPDAAITADSPAVTSGVPENATPAQPGSDATSEPPVTVQSEAAEKPAEPTSAVPDSSSSVVTPPSANVTEAPQVPPVGSGPAPTAPTTKSSKKE